ncbi:MAG: hypothetical protein ACR2QC_12360 [Gammaproteobacteria bacterium]
MAAAAYPDQSARTPPPAYAAAASGAGVRLFLCGFLILFLELALIRFLSGNIWNLGYFPNLVLLAAFVGLGAGFLAHGRCIRTHLWFLGAPILVFALVAGVYALRPGVPGFDAGSGILDTELFWTVGNKKTNAFWGLFVLWFLITAAVFALIAQFTAKAFRLFEPLTAYSLDIGGSLAGAGAFMIVSFLHIPAAWWFVFAGILWAGAFFAGGGGRPAALIGGLACFVVSAAVILERDNFDPVLRGGAEWSPYQKVTYQPGPQNDVRIVYVNNINHQQMHSEEVVRKSFYSYIYALREDSGLPPYERVMVVGAGNGNDVAAALIHGAEFVHAVEIDPVIMRLGAEHHPLSPYASPRVSATIDDGRHVLFAEDAKYDLIIFALTDSLVKASPVSQLRLENYLFTEEAMRRAWSQLQDGGTLMLYNFYRQDWLVQKLLAMVAKAGETTPRGEQYGNFTIIYATKTGEKIAPPPAPAALEIPTDDWPFLYLNGRGVPKHYVAAIAILVLCITAVFYFAPAGGDSRRGGEGVPRLRLAFMAMGAAFLLLETKSVIQFSLLFGTTWFTAAIVFFGALSLVLAANWTARLIPSPRLAPAAFALLGLSCLAVLAYPLANLVSWESAAARAVAASLLVFVPIYFANLVFAVLFRGRGDAEKYFGWNLLGGTLGGAAEYAGMATGYHILAWVVLACYAAVFLCVLPEMRRGIRITPPPPPYPLPGEPPQKAEMNA